ncbi:MAG: bacteriohopanetetrol glucosamine biosynthesis glycosyltransferase HpnI [Syntrophobacteraceae bacterium]
MSIEYLLAFLGAASLCYYAASMLAARRFFSREIPPPLETPPPVSIMIPLRGADFRAYENYASICRQDYPQFQIVFGVGDPRDSSIELVRQLQAGFPDIAIDLAISRDEIGENPKVNNLNNMLPLARHETLVLMDSDIRVGPDFLQSVISELVHNGGGVLTCLYRAGEAPGPASKLEAVGITTEFAPGVLLAEVTAGISFAFGATIAMEKRTLRAIGGFAAIADYLADDYMIGNLARKAGLPVRLSRYVVETVLHRMSLADFIKHQVRWARGIRACNRLGHTGSLITNGTAIAALFLLFSGFSFPGWLFLLAAVTLRLANAWYLGVRLLGDQLLPRYFLLVLIRDFFSFFFWCAAIFGKHVIWRGKLFVIDRIGKMKAVG